ncbi:hypothetical protein ACKWTF_016237 [Chironomus riparius]
MLNKMSINFWILVILIISHTNGDHNIHDGIKQLTEQTESSAKKFTEMKSKLEIDIDEIKDLNEINENILKDFQTNLLIIDIINQSDLEKLIELQDQQLKAIEGSLPNIINEILKIDRKLDTWNGNSNEIFNEFEKIQEFIPIGLLSIFIFFIVLKIIVAKLINDNNDPHDKGKQLKSKARKANDNQSIVTHDYERPIQHPEQKYVNVNDDKKHDFGKKQSTLKNDSETSFDEKPVFFGFTNKLFDNDY